MKRKTSYYFSLAVFCVLSFSARGQDGEYSQFYANPLYLNPGFAGTSSHARVIVNYRNQWPSLGNTYVNYSVSYDRFVQPVNGGIGLQLADNIEAGGSLRSSSAYLFYSYHIQATDRLFLNAALQAGMIYKGFSPNDLIFPSEINQQNGQITPGGGVIAENATKMLPDFGVGVLGQLDSYYFGLSIQHLSQPDESLIEGDQKGRLPRKYTIHAGMQTHKFRNGLLSKPYTLSPNIIFQQQGSFRQLNLGMYVNMGPLSGGVWYRQNLSARPDAIIAMLGLKRDRFKISYSYDFTLSQLSNYSFGSHELSLVLYPGAILQRDSRRFAVIPEL